MRSKAEFLKRVRLYGFRYIYEEGVGNIAWCMGTGDNIEFMFLQSARPGGGKEIYRMAVKAIKEETPSYHSAYTFTKTDNAAAIGFYTKLGWNRVDLGQSVYRDAETTMFWIPFQELSDNLGAS